MAEGLLRAELGPGIIVSSAGLGAPEGWEPHPEAARLMAEQGIDIGGHRSRQVSEALALGADLILVMETPQETWCQTLFPSARGRVRLLGCWLDPGSREIADPFGKGPEAFRLACEQIREAVSAWKTHLEGS